MREIGIDVRTEFPKPLTDEVVRAADVVVTLGCGDACPVFPGKRYEDWDVADPAGQPLEVVRRIRYDIHHHVATCSNRWGIHRSVTSRRIDPGEALTVHRVAVITDIHGNLPALQASLDALDALGVDEHLLRRRSGRLRTAPERGVRADRRAARSPRSTATTTTRSPRSRRLRVRVHRPSTTASSASSRSRGRSPTPIRAPRTSCAACRSTCTSESASQDVHLVHGSPRKVNEYLFEDKPASLYERLAKAEDAQVMVFGHTHKPWVNTFGGVLFVNCGSVGKPKDGDPRAAFAILEARRRRAGARLDRAGPVRRRGGRPRGRGRWPARGVRRQARRRRIATGGLP